MRRQFSRLDLNPAVAVGVCKRHLRRTCKQISQSTLKNKVYDKIQSAKTDGWSREATQAVVGRWLVRTELNMRRLGMIFTNSYFIISVVEESMYHITQEQTLCILAVR